MTQGVQEATPMSIPDRLRNLDTCAVSDALDALGLPGATSGIGAVSAGSRVAGTVVTVELGPALATPSAQHLCTSAIEAANPGDVIIVAHQSRSDCAGWGGNLSRAAAKRGVAATIVDGAVRDVEESESLGYPVFATGVTPRTARGRAQEYRWGHQVVIKGIVVAVGDYVLADGSGVVFIASGDADRVVDKAESIARREEVMALRISKGTPVSEVMGAGYEQLLSRKADT